MDDVTDVVFRSVIADCAPPDMFFTEFVNVDGLCSRGRANIIHKLSINQDKDHHIVAQIWGKVPDNYRTVSSELAGMGFHGVDINMGCPAKNEVKNGCCSALINNRDLAREIILATQEGAGDLPVSVKTRLGWNEIDLSWHEFLLGFKLNMLTIHMRTRQEMSKVPAHWDIFPEIVALRDKISPTTKLVINGDIEDYAHGLEVAKQTGADGVMIGRGIFKNPYCFAEVDPWPDTPKNERIALYKKQVDQFIATWSDSHKNPQGLKKFCKVYINGFDGASELRDEIMHTTTAPEISAILQTHLVA
ncbi:MAG: tRNA-dihydrouridine synthase [Patescibacteria group bacterium]|nr:tRNA-dihydrouridine synthase [Patescibacteria group bacterium]